MNNHTKQNKTCSPTLSREVTFSVTPRNTIPTLPTTTPKKVTGICQIYSGLRKSIFSQLAIHSRFCDTQQTVIKRVISEQTTRSRQKQRFWQQIKTKPSYRISFIAYFHISERCRLTSSDLTSPSSSTVSRNSFLNCAFYYVLTDLSATVMYKITEDMCSPDFLPIGQFLYCD